MWWGYMPSVLVSSVVMRYYLRGKLQTCHGYKYRHPFFHGSFYFNFSYFFLVCPLSGQVAVLHD
jgi:hypothetical protein